MRKLPITTTGLLLASLAACSTPDDTGVEDDAAEVASLPPLAMAFDASLDARALATGPDGDILFGGTFTTDVSFGGGNLSPEPQGSVFVAHLDANGRHLFSATTGSKDQVTSVAIGAARELYVAGGFNGKINFGSGTLAGSYDAYFAAFTKGGEPDHSFSAGGEAGERFDSVASSPLGQIFLAGRFGDDADLGGGAAPQFSQVQSTVVSYDEDGHHLWELRFSGNGPGEIELASDGAGSVYVAGDSYQTVTIGDLTTPEGAFFLAVGPDGEPRWLVSAHGPEGFVRSGGLAADRAGNVFVSGTFSESFALGGLSAPEPAFLGGFVAKISPDGEPLFLKTFDIGDYSTKLRLAASDDGGVVLATTSYNQITFDSIPVGSDTYDVAIARFGPELDLIAAESLPGTGHEQMFALAMSPDGSPVILGGFDDTVTIGDTQLTANVQGYNLFLARLDF